jgi:hypothetical protein
MGVGGGRMIGNGSMAQFSNKGGEIKSGSRVGINLNACFSTYLDDFNVHHDPADASIVAVSSRSVMCWQTSVR